MSNFQNIVLHDISYQSWGVRKQHSNVFHLCLTHEAFKEGDAFARVMFSNEHSAER